MRLKSSHSSQSLCGPNLPLVHSKVMRNFMPECLLDQLFQLLAAACYSLVGPLEYGDSVGQMERFKNAAMCQGTPFIQSEKRAAGRDFPRLKLGRRRLILDYYRYVIHTASESCRNVA